MFMSFAVRWLFFPKSVKSSVGLVKTTVLATYLFSEENGFKNTGGVSKVMH